MKNYKFLGLLAAAMLAVTSWSCSDDDALTPLDKTDLTAGDATYNSLHFSWDKVNGARQYSYQFTQTATGDIIETGVTKETSASFSGLTHDTEYTLTVLAYAAMGSANTTSEPIILTARTADLTTLSTPQPAWSREVNTVIITWDAVDGARNYAYSLTDADGNSIGEGSTFSSSIEFSAMQTGSYTFTLTAQTETEGFRNSEPATLNFEFTREHEEIWRTSGIYNSSLLDNSWTAELVAYDDNSYEILAWYGVADYNFSFSLDENNASDMFRPDASYSYNASTGAYTVPTGIASPAMVSVFASGNRCAFEGTAGKGSIILNVSDGNKTDNDRFTWGGASIEDFVGTWTCDFAGYDTSSSDYDEFYNGQVEIALGTEENTLLVPLPTYMGFYWGDGVATLKVDMSTMTFTTQPLSFNYSGYIYILAGTSSDTAPLTGKLTEKGITFDGIQIWCSGYTYLYDTSYLKYTR